MDKPLVAVVMGSDSDYSVMRAAVETLAQFGIPYEVEVISAHRSPERTRQYAAAAISRGLKVIIAGAGGAAHLAGVIAAETTLPVIGVPLGSSPLGGFDALLATVQMPAGVPVATMAVGEAGAKNAAVLAAQILALSDESLRQKLLKYKVELAASVEARSKKLKAELSGTRT